MVYLLRLKLTKRVVNKETTLRFLKQTLCQLLSAVAKVPKPKEDN
ncbi:MAG: hypothetical protein JWQ66_1684 [Mucilaginibacter sp.]|nr:hypothetical protein [Mucilaginibacter sp.]